MDTRVYGVYCSCKWQLLARLHQLRGACTHTDVHIHVFNKDVLNHPMIWAKVVEKYPGLHRGRTVTESAGKIFWRSPGEFSWSTAIFHSCIGITDRATRVQSDGVDQAQAK